MSASPDTTVTIHQATTVKAFLFIITPHSGKLHVTHCHPGVYDSDLGEIEIHSRIDDASLPAPYFMCTLLQHTIDRPQGDDEYLNIFVRPLHVVTGPPRYNITPSYIQPNIHEIQRVSDEWMKSKDPLLEKCAKELRIWLRDTSSIRDQSAFVS